MNIIKKVMIAAGTASVALAPIAATAAAPVTTVAAARAVPSTADGSDLRGREGGSGSAILLGILALGAIAVAIVIAADQDDDTPISR